MTMKPFCRYWHVFNILSIFLWSYLSSQISCTTEVFEIAPSGLQAPKACIFNSRYLLSLGAQSKLASYYRSRGKCLGEYGDVIFCLAESDDFGFLSVEPNGFVRLTEPELMQIVPLRNGEKGSAGSKNVDEHEWLVIQYSEDTFDISIFGPAYNQLKLIGHSLKQRKNAWSNSIMKLVTKNFIEGDFNGSTYYKNSIDVVFAEPGLFLLKCTHVHSSALVKSLLPPMSIFQVLPSCPTAFFPSLSGDPYILDGAELDEVEAFIMRNNRFVKGIINTPFFTNSTQLDFVMKLTGREKSLANVMYSRHSLATSIRDVAEWIRQNLDALGFATWLHEFRPGFGPNIIAEWKGTESPEKVAIIGAHYDSRNKILLDKWGRSPGANDDASGMSALLMIATVIASSKLKFKNTIRLVAFCGEEQGLYGSDAYAAYLKSRIDEGQHEEVLMMVQCDMLAYRKAGENLQLAFPYSIHTPSLTASLKKVIAHFLPDLKICTSRACCSDHQSFLKYGFKATSFFERCGPIADPMYHSAGDVPNRTGYDFEHLAVLTKALFIAAAFKGELIS